MLFTKDLMNESVYGWLFSPSRIRNKIHDNESLNYMSPKKARSSLHIRMRNSEISP